MSRQRVEIGGWGYKNGINGRYKVQKTTTTYMMGPKKFRYSDEKEGRVFEEAELTGVTSY